MSGPAPDVTSDYAKPPGFRRGGYVDFSVVERHHSAIHERLLNWARACFGSHHSATHPMFRQYTSPEHWDGAMASIPIDHRDAVKIGRGVSFLPTPHRLAVQWWYVRPTSPRAACQAIGCTYSGLALFVRDARQMLVNRGV